MTCEWLIIDGYNLLHQDEALTCFRHDLQVARRQLVRKVEGAAPEMARRISVVFDGRQKGRDAALDAPHIEVLFSPANRTADAVIERMVSDADDPSRIVVVTSDQVEARIVSSAGATVMSCQSFLFACGDASRAASTQVQRSRQCRPGSTLGDFFPDSEDPFPG
jgi:predicted RNA-binding protein with PIN domain